MGMICPECKTYQPQVKVMDALGEAPKKSEQVFLIQLGCSHVVGADKAKAYVEAITKIRRDYSDKRSKLDDQQQADIVAAWKSLKGEG